MGQNLGNVVGLLRGEKPPAKTYVLWGKILDVNTPDVVELRYYKGTGDPLLEINWLPLACQNCTIDYSETEQLTGRKWIDNRPEFEITSTDDFNTLFGNTAMKIKESQTDMGYYVFTYVKNKNTLLTEAGEDMQTEDGETIIY